MELCKVVRYLDKRLRIGKVPDWANALNGLQVENDGKVTRIGAAVDACEAVLTMAVERGVDLLLVHHGLFWGGLESVTQARYRKLRKAFDGNLAIYSAHLPLDVHAQIGNNILLAKALGATRWEPFFEAKGIRIGVKGALRMDRDLLKARVEKVVGGAVHLCPGGPARTRALGIVTGGAGGEIAKAAAEGVDTFITGEGPHHSYTLAEELGVNLIYAGHYATEVFGVKAAAKEVGQKFLLPWEFLHHPTGL